jgi:hypothetical protein
MNRAALESMDRKRDGEDRVEFGFDASDDDRLQQSSAGNAVTSTY